MKCAYHPDVDAVGMCVNCGRAICESCQMFLKDKIYCKVCFGSMVTMPAEAEAVKKVSWAWWLLPVFLGWLGGLIAFFATRSRNPGKARNMLIVGIVITVFYIIISVSGG